LSITKTDCIENQTLKNAMTLSGVKTREGGDVIPKAIMATFFFCLLSAESLAREWPFNISVHGNKKHCG
jgi:hypothetical protein